MSKRNKNYADILSDLTKDYIETLKNEITRLRVEKAQLINKQHEILGQLDLARDQRNKYYQMTEKLEKRISELEKQEEGF
ncbi:hypothetical protein K8P03_11075 [Anaerococcus murdochii]|uniref:Uncharacterized protein n=1 Tax=Anaerococcus murdochii TaxID=411577 RepID=A0ABS7SW66_9FIRM|nr:hypothetical protein [Anaerococcus murdochii]MBZ2385782.1 hypothetical protein [Anaerococcus murdochii]MBZ2387814.1 hypothetical protein [Anaerococcus murdochii]